jgi:hypothetical protein
MFVACYHCRAETEFKGPVGRRDTCCSCDRELRCCLQCRLFDPNVPNSCKEPAADAPREKDHGNFCEFFSPGRHTDRDADAAQKARTAFDALFSRKGS